MITGMPVERFPQLGAKAKDVVADPDLCRLVRLVLRACQPDPQQRQADARAMVAELADAERAPGAAASGPRRWWLAGAASIVLIAGLSGVGYWFSRPPRVHVNFTTHPFEATVLIDGQQQITFDGQPYTTPCTIEDLPARRHQVLFRLPGRSDLNAGQIDFGRSREIKAHWEGEQQQPVQDLRGAGRHGLYRGSVGRPFRATLVRLR